MQEEWRPVVGYEESHEVSNLGRVRSKTRLVERTLSFDTSKKAMYPYKGKLMNFYITRKGYHRTSLNGKKHLVHRLVADAFIPKVEGKTQVNHINGIKGDNRVENLEWCTNAENQSHAWSIGLNNGKTGWRKINGEFIKTV
jgi:hypothetical protein